MPFFALTRLTNPIGLRVSKIEIICNLLLIALLDRRKHSSGMILTSNRDVSEWGEIFPEPVLASAAIDRIFDRADIVLFRGESYRLKGRINHREIDGEKKE